MQAVVIDKPYKFVPPYEGNLWPAVLLRFLPYYMNRVWGIASHECRQAELIRASVEAGHGVILAPNHCRPCDPMALGFLMPHVRSALHAMGSWHLFMAGPCTQFFARRCGAFSVYREGMDRQAVNAAIDILERASRPLIIFPEGVITRTNDKITNLLEGAAFIARSAAKKRAKLDPPKKVVVHPVAIKYFFRGDVQTTVDAVLSEIEHRLAWRPQRQLSLIDRVYKTGEALLTLKEIEYFGHYQTGTLQERLTRLIDHILVPLENEWLAGKRDSHVVGRVKKLRIAILPDMVNGEITPEERERRWRQLADMYLAQQLGWYPPDYVRSRPTPERLLETVERFEEDLTDKARIHRPLHVVIQAAEAIEVNPERDRSAATDPLLAKIAEQIQGMLDRLKEESQPIAMNASQTA